MAVLFYTFDVPDFLDNTQAATRLHNKVTKEALRQELIKHHKKRLPLHFDQNNRNKYNHKPRSAKYKAMKYKKWRSQTDLVASGATKLAMTKSTPTPVMSGTARGPRGLGGKITYKFPFTQTTKFKESQKKRYSKKPEQRRPPVVGVTIAQMRKEIETIIPEEQHEIAQSLEKNYGKMLRSEIRQAQVIKRRFG